MSLHQAFRRQPVPPETAQTLKAMAIPAPIRGLVLNENWAYMKPGAAMVLDNWAPTTRSLKLRGGYIRHCTLPETTPIISMFEYVASGAERMFAGNATKLYDVTAASPTMIKSGQASGNYAASQLANASGQHMLVCNDAGDDVLHYDGATWTTFSAGQITGPPGSTVVAGHNLTYVWKYRNRYFFIEGGSMNAYYLATDAYQGLLQLIPLAGSATQGGKLMWGATWSLDAGDGIDEKCVFATDQGELLIFTGTDPSSAANWRQEGRYSVGDPMGMNAHMSLGGDLLMATVDGIVPMSAVITKEAGQLDLNMVTAAIKPMWRDEVAAKRTMPWTMKRWDEYGGFFVTFPGGTPGNRFCGVVNSATGAWARYTGWDATCFAHISTDFYFGTQGGIVMQAERTGTDDGEPYVATVVGGWEMFQSAPYEIVWHQARAVFRSAQAFEPQLAATTDYQIIIPQPPPPATGIGTLDLWDQGKWDTALWDQGGAAPAPVRNTMWVSIGSVGFSHAPIVQVTVAQAVPPTVELVSIACTYETLGVNV